jgi:hypothetical protein
MKGVHNRQKMVVRPKESVQKYLIQQKAAQGMKATNRRECGRKGFAARGK